MDPRRRQIIGWIALIVWIVVAIIAFAGGNVILGIIGVVGIALSTLQLRVVRR